MPHLALKTKWDVSHGGAASGTARSNVPAQICEFLVDALQGHRECVMRCVVMLGRECLSTIGVALQAGRQVLFICQSKWNAGEKGRRFPEKHDDNRTANTKKSSVPEKGYRDG